MKKLILIFAVLASTITFSQRSFDQYSIEVNYGISLPSSPVPNGANVSDFTGYSHFDIGARYMFIPEIGVKLSYGYDKFSDKDISSNNVIYNRFELQAVSNLVYLFSLESELFNKVGFLAHGGGGIISANPSSFNSNENIGILTFGLTPQFKLSEKFALSTDFSYNITLKQHYSFDGQLIHPNFDSETGGFFNFTVGLKYYIGSNGEHADWL
ncbi:MAG: hypothetical protein QM499_01925 [Flavobacteriaceae bacterium]